MTSRIIFIFVLITLIACRNTRDQKPLHSDEINSGSSSIKSINLAHLNHLYKEVTLPDGKGAAIIHIYSDYPDYKYDIEPKEGFTCVDDVARALVLLAEENKTEDQLSKLIEFLLYMQNENGWFNNFIWKDLSINTTYQTTVAEPNWWSWRALWAFEKALPKIEHKYPELAARVKGSLDTLIENIKSYLSGLSQTDKKVNGISIATNLPFESAADQASILLIGLCHTYERTKAETLLKYMRQLADGIIRMQIKHGELKGMFLSWENVWHAYGNCQSYALLMTGKILMEEKYVDAALLEIDNFYLYLHSIRFAELLKLESRNDSIFILENNPYPQIAYGIRPIVYACVEAYNQTNREEYKIYANQWLSWFHGANVASMQMYDPITGRCYDGIQSKGVINKNSGAESTIEALLSIQAFQSIE